MRNRTHLNFQIPAFLNPMMLLIAGMLFVGFIVAIPLETLAGPPSAPVLKKVPASHCPVFGDDLNFDALGPAISGSIRYYEKFPEDRRFSFGTDAFTAIHLIGSLKQFLAFIEKQPSPEELCAFVGQSYDVYAYVQNDIVHEVLFTGYYEPLLNGSLEATPAFKYPVYAHPEDLTILNPSDFSDGRPRKEAIGRIDGKIPVPYYTRREIAGMAPAEFNAPVIAWVDDPVALFFLQVQGSGKIRLETGGLVNVHYRISNGHPYKSIGKYLIDKKKLAKEAVSMQSIRKYLYDHPDERDEVLNYNPRYVFFEITAAGPTGCYDIELTPGRSLALDRQIFPAGALAFVQAEKPVVGESGEIVAWAKFSRFFLNQDTGSAIKGPGRADIFWGNGPYAELAAGYMKQPGRLFFLVLRPGI